MQWMMLQQDEPRDYVIATGVQFSVRDFIEKAAARLGIALKWRGSGVDEEGVVAGIEGSDAPALREGQTIVRIDPRYFRPSEVDALIGDASRAKKELGWSPEITIDEMIDEMVAHDLDSARRQTLLNEHGFNVVVGPPR
jgi:GDPmannose 4,6-dehydratase